MIVLAPCRRGQRNIAHGGWNCAPAAAFSGDFIEQGPSYGPGAFFVEIAGTSHGPHQSSSGCTVLTPFSAPLDFQMGKPEGEAN
jgi:hypothetical protein